jgi:hypothetical protein
MRRLTGNRCQCTVCGEHFNGVQPFDKHRAGRYAKPGEWQGNRRCLTVAEMEARGFIRNAAGFWCDRASEHAMRPRAHGFSPRRAPSAMVQPTPAPRAPETRTGALP